MSRARGAHLLYLCFGTGPGDSGHSAGFAFLASWPHTDHASFSGNTHIRHTDHASLISAIQTMLLSREIRIFKPYLAVLSPF